MTKSRHVAPPRRYWTDHELAVMRATYASTTATTGQTLSASGCGLTECAGKPMCQRCAVAAGAVLKPCPWCWTDGADLFDLWDRFDAGHIAHVHCTHCGADGPSCYSETSADDAIKQARHRWNSRMVAPRKPPNVALQPLAEGESAGSAG